jgi:hypothetical protein
MNALPARFSVAGASIVLTTVFGNTNAAGIVIGQRRADLMSTKRSVEGSGDVNCPLPGSRISLHPLTAQTVLCRHRQRHPRVTRSSHWRSRNVSQLSFRGGGQGLE